ncbi:uncharacterized protein [Montipora foliosa]|uniref:uncharacterized protein n=1 Tax=Montipora foliosa TaxID=591990 RepID=UPI0035F1A779
MRLKAQTNRHHLTKGMKADLLLNIAAWLLLTITQGQSIRCFSCHDSENNPSCRRRMMELDCSLHAEFGDTYDSCFSMTAYNGKSRKQIKDCAIRSGCKELEDILCEDFKKKKNYTCRVDCCEDDLCNEYGTVEQVYSAGNIMTYHIQIILLSFAVFLRIIYLF